MENSGPATAVTVSQLNRQVKALLERGVGRLWVEGEISNLARPASGHLYFRLKDESAQISAAFFRNRQRAPTIGIKDGDHVIAFAQVSLYEARGDYQLIVEKIEPAGEGVLKRRYEALKKKLSKEGLFDEERKQSLPALPRQIGIVTSPSGAAVRDVLTILRKRFPAIPVVIYPAAVQGDAAPGELIAALETAFRRSECDVLILTRGGGSLEDLWAFNDEQLARTIADAPIPVISAVGHEVDFTIADFAADVRAPTPSGAAELAVPDAADWLRRLDGLARRIAREGRRALDDRYQSLDWLSRRLLSGSPAVRLSRQADRLREVRGRMAAAVREQIHDGMNTSLELNGALMRASPALAVQRSLGRAAALRQRLAAAGRRSVAGAAHALQLTARALDGVSPLATLDRGYAVITDANGKALMRARDVKQGDDIRARLAQGEFVATVRAVIDESN